MSHLFHTHLLIKAFIKQPPMEVEPFNVWLKKLVELVGMQVLFGPTSVFCSDLENEGITGVIGLTTSHASFHCWHLAPRPFFQFDLYSCKDFDVDTVINFLHESFVIDECDYILIDRNEELKVIKSGKVSY